MKLLTYLSMEFVDVMVILSITEKIIEGFRDVPVNSNQVLFNNS